MMRFIFNVILTIAIFAYAGIEGFVIVIIANLALLGLFAVMGEGFKKLINPKDD
jgi:hypothetical protein